MEGYCLFFIGKKSSPPAAEDLAPWPKSEAVVNEILEEGFGLTFPNIMQHM